MPLDPLVKAFLDQAAAIPRPKPWEMPLGALRKSFAGMMGLVGPKDVPVGKIENFKINGPQGDIRARAYAPVAAGGAAMPVLVYFHGGGFVVGDLNTHDGICRLFAHEGGFRVVAVDYRLAPENKWPSPLEDAFAALNHVFDNAAALGIDAARIAVGGDSAGGHLAVFLAALDKPVLGEYAELLPGVSPKADCAVDWFAPVDFSGFLQHYGMMRMMFVGVAPADYASAERSASALFAVGPHTAPVLIAHGAEDRMVSIKQSEALRDALTRDGVPNRLQVFHGGHEFAGDTDERRAYIDRAVAFTKDPLGFLKTKPD